MKNIKNPNSQLSETLFFLLKRDIINVKQMMWDTGIINLSARLSDLKLQYNLPIELKKVKTINKFGRNIEFGNWTLLDKKMGLEIYNELIK